MSKTRRKQPSVYSKKAQGRPMGHMGGPKRLRKQIKQQLRNQKYSE